MGPPRCWHCGHLVPNIDSAGHPKPGRTPKTCSDRCRKRMQLRLPNVPKRKANHTDLDALPFDPNWIPRHPVDEPVVLDYCQASDCHEPLNRRGQLYCSTRCRVAGMRAGASQMKGWRERAEQRRIATIRQATLINDAIDHCRRCDDDGRLQDGSVCDQHRKGGVRPSRA